MSVKGVTYWISILSCLVAPTAAHAWFFFIPIPNVAKPAQLNAIIEALEKSDETKAVAYASEDKTFRSKMWVWGQFSGHVPQAEADRIALSQCEAGLARAKAQKAGGKELYDFGKKTCELHNFENKTISPRANEWQPPTAAAVTMSTPPTPSAPSSSTTDVGQPSAAGVAPTTPPPEQPLVTQPTTVGSIASPPATNPAQAEPAVVPASPPASATAQAPAPVPQGQQAQVSTSPTNESATARRLRELNDLRKQGLITEQEYNEKRKAILSAL